MSSMYVSNMYSNFAPINHFNVIDNRDSHFEGANMESNELRHQNMRREQYGAYAFSAGGQQGNHMPQQMNMNVQYGKPQNENQHQPNQYEHQMGAQIDTEAHMQRIEQREAEEEKEINAGALILFNISRSVGNSTTTTRSPTPDENVDTTLQWYPHNASGEPTKYKKKRGPKGTKNSVTGKKPRKRKQSGQSENEEGERVTRPINCFMAFAKDMRQVIRARLQKETGEEKVDNRLVSTILGTEWSRLPQAEKDKYLVTAAKHAEEHRAKYPAYKFTRTKSSKPRKLSKSESLDSNL
eukprot:Nk52_evm3s2208 gene=Nk52_evmTU3s2208